jgi:hypothetical protein
MQLRAQSREGASLMLRMNGVVDIAKGTLINLDASSGVLVLP